MTAFACESTVVQALAERLPHAMHLRFGTCARTRSGGVVLAGPCGVVLWESELCGERTVAVTTSEPSGPQEPADGPEPRSYEPGPSAGKLMLFVAVFVAFAVIVVGGGVILTSGG
ncbi:hypothetical protein CG723_15175 [Streptomyces sp. CB01635]|nr:hypothetical protein CG723_15175 [Streptomyces sp. CB01635]